MRFALFIPDMMNDMDGHLQDLGLSDVISVQLDLQLICVVNNDL